jgi:hypothetical protein
LAHGDLSSGGGDGAGSGLQQAKKNAVTGAGAHAACQKKPRFGHSRQSMVGVWRGSFELVQRISSATHKSTDGIQGKE